jgi:DNA (cytosine-5)-methyltransferase 1
VSTFSGCGGSSLGYRIEGFRVLWASEFVEAARETYRANAPDYTVLDGRDIREVQPAEVLGAIGLDEGELDLLDGSPPCASFSMAGKRQKHWGEVKAYSDTKQRTDDLFPEFARLVRGIQPRVFVAENVSGLVRGTAKGYFIRILSELRDCGYRVRAKLLDAQWLGVPQARQRLIFVGVRNDLNLLPAFPEPLPYRYSISEAAPGIIDAPSVDPETQADISIERFAIGREWIRLAPGEGSNRYLNLTRARLDRPSPTVTALGGNVGAAAVAHPSRPRKYNLGELRAICGFPPDFVLTGTFEQRWERLGRAVPPLMMRRIAAEIRDRVLDPATETRRAS